MSTGMHFLLIQVDVEGVGFLSLRLLCLVWPGACFYHDKVLVLLVLSGVMFKSQHTLVLTTQNNGQCTVPGPC